MGKPSAVNWAPFLLKRIAPTLLTGLVLVAGMLALVQLRYRSWERHIERTPGGIARFALPFTVGTGSEALLLVHGFGDSPRVWSDLAPALAAHGYTVHAMRLPGWGEPLSAKAHITREDWLAAVERKTEVLRAQHPSLIVIAHSLGGALTAELAIHGRLDADALILYAPMIAVSAARSPLLTPRQWFEIGRRLFPAWMPVESPFPDHLRTGIPRPRTLRDPFVPYHFYHSLYETMDALHAPNIRVDVPVHMVLPGEDRVVCSPAATAWLERLAAPCRSLHTEARAGHVLPLNLDVSREAERIHHWIRNRLIQTPPTAP